MKKKKTTTTMKAQLSASDYESIHNSTLFPSNKHFTCFTKEYLLHWLLQL